MHYYTSVVTYLLCGDGRYHEITNITLHCTNSEI